jgi:hypothetical protein
VYAWAHPALVQNLQQNEITITPSTASVATPRAPRFPALSDGGLVANVVVPSPLGTVTRIAGFSKDGHLRWLNACAGREEMQAIPENRLLLMWNMPEANCQMLDEDGLGLGTLGQPRAAHWGGNGPAHAPADALAWLGNDGQPYEILFNDTLGAYQWFHITGADQIQRARFPVHIKKGEG